MIHALKIPISPVSKTIVKVADNYWSSLILDGSIPWGDLQSKDPYVNILISFEY